MKFQRWTLGKGTVRVRVDDDSNTLIAECYTTHNGHRYTYNKEERESVAKFIVQSPALYLAMELLKKGKARIETSSISDFSEFCYNGIRYPINGNEWNTVIDLIGWERVKKDLGIEE